jgi:hypothetical protein
MPQSSITAWGGPEQEMGVVPVVELHKVEVLTKVA